MNTSDYYSIMRMARERLSSHRATAIACVQIICAMLGAVLIATFWSN